MRMLQKTTTKFRLTGKQGSAAANQAGKSRNWQLSWQTGRAALIKALVFVFVLMASMVVLPAQERAPDASRQSIKPINERMVILLDKHYERFDSSASYSQMPERLASLLLAAQKTERFNYRGTTLDKEGEEKPVGFDMTVFHFQEEHELKFAITALFKVYGIDHTRLFQAARVKKTNAPPFILIGSGTTMTLISAECDAFPVKSLWLDFSELVRTLTIQARTVCVNSCKGPIYLD